jgi:plastocyanin
MNNRIFIVLVILAAGVLAGWYYLKGNPRVSPAGQTSQVTPTPSGSNLGAPPAVTGSGAGGVEKGGVAARTVVTYTYTGFAPKPTTVRVGDTVTFVNESSGQMWVASDPHPTHTLLPGFDELQSVGKGGTYEYTFTKVGTWTFHNHMSPGIKGTVVATQ